MEQLSAKKQAFVDAFLGKARGNATQAAKLAGYSPRTARQIGHRLLTKVDIHEAVSMRVKRREAQTDLTNEYIDAQVRKLAERGRDEKTRLGAWKELNKVRGRHSIHVNVREKTWEDLVEASRKQDA